MFDAGTVADGRQPTKETELTRQQWFAAGAAAGFLGVAFGAFGAHALPPEARPTFTIGARYHMYHALAIALVAVAPISERARSFAGTAFVCGIVLFAGSLYALSISGTKWLGAITPIGGLAFLIGWLVLFVSALRQPAQTEETLPRPEPHT